MNVERGTDFYERNPAKTMSVIRTTAGTAEVLIETVTPYGQNTFSGMEDTSKIDALSGIATDAFKSAQEVIGGIAKEISNSIMKGRYAPSETKVGFSMSLTTEGNLWLIRSGSDMTLNVELTWKKAESK